MNTIKSVIYAVFVMLVALFSSCSGNSSQKSAVHAEKEAKVYDVDELLTVSSSLVGDTVRVIYTHRSVLECLEFHHARKGAAEQAGNTRTKKNK